MYKKDYKEMSEAELENIVCQAEFIRDAEREEAMISQWEEAGCPEVNYNDIETKERGW
jgi:hypothetical protein